MKNQHSPKPSTTELRNAYAKYIASRKREVRALADVYVLASQLNLLEPDTAVDFMENVVEAGKLTGEWADKFDELFSKVHEVDQLSDECISRYNNVISTAAGLNLKKFRDRLGSISFMRRLDPSAVATAIEEGSWSNESYKVDYIDGEFHISETKGGDL